MPDATEIDLSQVNPPLGTYVGCGCYRCRESRELPRERFIDLGEYMSQLAGSIMVVCEWCGNKRCPHATDHNHACTGSNEPGQIGSRFQ